jgi:hypothetical protein
VEADCEGWLAMTLAQALAKVDGDLTTILERRWDELFQQMLFDGCSFEGASVMLEEQKAVDMRVQAPVSH